MDENFDKELTVRFGRYVKAARIKRNIKQEELCARANLDRSYLSKIETGAYKVTLVKAYALAIAMGCALEEILPEIENGSIKPE
jgi:transcriptional regulator with XRE-family HTH domain